MVLLSIAIFPIIKDWSFLLTLPYCFVINILWELLKYETIEKLKDED
jgi:hypothetical protein